MRLQMINYSVKLIAASIKKRPPKVRTNGEFQNAVLQQLKNITEEQKALRKDLNRLELRMENEVIDKVRILFDAREIQDQRLERIDDRMQSIEIDTGYLVSRVARLEKAVK